MTPEAPIATAKHQHPSSFFLPRFPTFASFHNHLLLQSYLPSLSLPPLHSFASFVFSSSHHHYAAGSQNVKLVTPTPSFSFHPHLLHIFDTSVVFTLVSAHQI
ncbi:hypothetical protein AMECASPLE_031789 [Ameca splendens]|uniref:Uncharacterized protein n=1 Tax=Ameca splendens TaxID=208324 RepID=A0ABV0XJB3_9TELE